MYSKEISSNRTNCLHCDAVIVVVVVADAKRRKTNALPDSMTGVAVYFHNVTPPSLVSKLARHVTAYPSMK